MKIRKKPVVINAFQWKGDPDDLWNWLFEECGVTVLNTPDICRIFNIDTNKELTIQTLEGDHRADLDDWILQGVKGEFYPCKPDIKELTYDEVVK